MPDYGYSKDALRAIVGLQGQFVGTTDTLILTNKTIVAEDNTIKQTTPALGSLLKDNGTKFIPLPRGTANQVLKVNSGGTDLDFGTLPVAGGGTGAATLTGVLIGNGTGAMTAKTNPAGAFLDDSSTQNVSGAKTFTNQTLKRRNPAGTFTLTEVHPAITADQDRRSYQAYRYLVQQEGSTYYVINGLTFGVEHSGSNPATEIQWAFDNLTAGRTYPEKVILKGDFVIGTTLLIETLTDLEVQGRMKLANTINASIIKNKTWTSVLASQDHHISIRGGEWDGNNANNVLGTGNSFISFRTAQNISASDMYIHDAKYGIICEGCLNAKFHNIQGKTFTKMLIIFDSDLTQGVSGYSCAITNCIAENCGINGLYGHGASATYPCFGFVISNCITHDCIAGGIYLDEKMYGFSCTNNYCYQNGDGTASGCGIWVNGEQDGIPYFSSGWTVVSGNVCYNNKNDGIFLTKVAHIQVSNNCCAGNRWNGIFVNICHDIQIINNLCMNNSQQTAGLWNGIDLVSGTGPDSILYPIKDNTISGNKCHDSQGTKTQQYGIQIRSTTTAFNNIIENNDCRYNRAGQNAGINTVDMSNCKNNLGFRTKQGLYNGTHPTDSTSGTLQGLISTFINGGTATIAKTIDSTGTHMTFTTAATSGDTAGAKVIPFTERDQLCILKCKFKLGSITSIRSAIAFSSDSNTNLTTIQNMLVNFSGAAFIFDSAVSNNWRLYTNGGGATPTATDSGVVADTNVHELQILTDDTTPAVLFILDNVLLTLAKITSQPPLSTADLGLYWAIQTTATGTKALDVWDIEVNQKD